MQYTFFHWALTPWAIYGHPGRGRRRRRPLTICGPTLRLGPERLAALGPELAREADALSKRLADNALPAA
jgi:hypothetical protein